MICQGLILVGLIMSRIWTLNAIEPLSYIVLFRIYVWIFQVNGIFLQTKKLPELFLNMSSGMITLAIHLVFIGKILLKNKPKASMVFYVVNGFVFVVGMVNKTVGFA